MTPTEPNKAEPQREMSDPNQPGTSRSSDPVPDPDPDVISTDSEEEMQGPPIIDLYSQIIDERHKTHSASDNCDCYQTKINKIIQMITDFDSDDDSDHTDDDDDVAEWDAQFASDASIDDSHRFKHDSMDYPEFSLEPDGYALKRSMGMTDIRKKKYIATGRRTHKSQKFYHKRSD